MQKENIKFIRKIDQTLEKFLLDDEGKEGNIQLILSNNGLPTLQYLKDDKPVFLHSKYNPVQEAEKIVEQLGDIDNYEHIFFFGIGLGYHVEILLKKYPHKRFTLVEPNKTVFQQYIIHKNLYDLPTQKLSFLKVGLSEIETKVFLEEFFNYVQEKTLLVTLPSYERFIPEQYKRFVEDFKKIILEKRSGLYTNYAFQKRWTLNSWINLPETLKTPNILHDIKKENFKNKPALLVAAGPSLNEELENIKHIKEKHLAYIFSVGSAINTLIENDIYPDAMCTYDPTAHNQKVFEKAVTMGIDTIPMIYGTSVGCETLKIYKGPKYHMVTSQDTVADFYLKRIDGNDFDKVSDAPSIAAVTLELLYKLGCSPIILVGQNLAYKDNKHYAKGIEYESVANVLTDDEISNTLKTKSVDGIEILTNETFNRMRSQIEYYIDNLITDVEVINTTKGGAHIEGTIFESLSTVISERLVSNHIEKEWYISKGYCYDFQNIKKQQQVMQSAFNELNESFKNAKKIINKLEQLTIDRNIVKLEKAYKKFDIEMKKFVKNDFYITFLQPMSRVEFDLLIKEINGLKFENDMISKSKKNIKSFKRFVNSCEFDIKNMNVIFEEINNVIEKI